jgi:hypothetical protein
MEQMMKRNGKRKVTAAHRFGDKFERIELIPGAIALFAHDEAEDAIGVLGASSSRCRAS